MFNWRTQLLELEDALERTCITQGFRQKGCEAHGQVFLSVCKCMFFVYDLQSTHKLDIIHFSFSRTKAMVAIGYKWG